MSGPLKIGENFATTLYGRQKPQSSVLQAAFKSLDQGKIAKDEILQIRIP